MKKISQWWNTKTMDEQDATKLRIGAMILIIFTLIACYLMYAGVMDWIKIWG